MPCNSTCSSCSGSNLTCTECQPGLSFFDGSCKNCTKNCIKCNSLVCIVCRPGFSINVTNGKCTQCLAKCSLCDANDITICISCSNGF